MSTIPFFRLSACEFLASWLSFHWAADPWQASHETPSDRRFSGDPSTWHVAHRLSLAGSAILRMSVMRLPRGCVRTAYASLCLSNVDHKVNSFCWTRLFSVRGSGPVPP